MEIWGSASRGGILSVTISLYHTCTNQEYLQLLDFLIFAHTRADTQAHNCNTALSVISYFRHLIWWRKHWSLWQEEAVENFPSPSTIALIKSRPQFLLYSIEFNLWYWILLRLEHCGKHPALFFIPFQKCGSGWLSLNYFATSRKTYEKLPFLLEGKKTITFTVFCEGCGLNP